MLSSILYANVLAALSVIPLPIEFFTLSTIRRYSTEGSYSKVLEHFSIANGSVVCLSQASRKSSNPFNFLHKQRVRIIRLVVSLRKGLLN